MPGVPFSLPDQLEFILFNLVGWNLCEISIPPRNVNHLHSPPNAYILLHISQCHIVISFSLWKRRLVLNKWSRGLRQMKSTRESWVKRFFKTLLLCDISYYYLQLGRSKNRRYVQRYFWHAALVTAISTLCDLYGLGSFLGGRWSERIQLFQIQL